MTATPQRQPRADQGTDLSLAQRQIQIGTRRFVSVSVLYGTSLHPRQAHIGRYRDCKISNRGLETAYMHLANRFVTALFLTAALATSGSIVAAATPRERSGESLRLAPPRLPQLGRPRRSRLSRIPDGTARELSLVRQTEPQTAG
jgi:hypothetical protein